MKNYSQLYQILQERGGLTLTFTGKEKITNFGYQVMVLDLFTVPAWRLNEARFEILMDILVASSVNAVEKNDIGFWYNEDDGLVYIDFSTQIYDFHEALAYGKANKQKAIYSWKTGESVNL